MWIRMSDLKSTPSAVSEETPRASVTAEIERSVGSIWQRRSGTRPSSVNTEINGDSVRCVIEEGEPEAAEPVTDGDAPELAGTDSNAYQHEASAAVSRITKRTVSAYIAKRDSKTGHPTQTFILERIRVKY